MSRSRRLNTRGIAVAAGVMACSLALLIGQTALAAPTQQGAAPVPHSLDGYYGYNCRVCHQPLGGMVAAPADHAGRSSSSCLSCHPA